MKIRHTSDKITSPPVRGNSASSGTPRKITGTGEVPTSRPSAGESGLPGRTFFNKSILSLISRLDGNNRIHLSLIPLLNQLRELPSGADGLPGNTKDKQLLIRILDAWKRVHGETLDKKTRKELENLERILRNDTEAVRYLFIQRPTALLPGILVREKEESTEKHSSGLSCGIDMTLNLNRLGKFQIIIEQKGKIRSCTILAENAASCKELKKARKDLLGRIKEKGLGPAAVNIRNQTPAPEGHEKTMTGGVDIWG